MWYKSIPHLKMNKFLNSRQFRNTDANLFPIHRVRQNVLFITKVKISKGVPAEADEAGRLVA